MDDSDSIIWEFKSPDRVFDTIRDKILAAREQGQSLQQMIQTATDVLAAQPADYRHALNYRDLTKISLLAQHGLRTIFSLTENSSASQTSSMTLVLMQKLTADAPPEPELNDEEMREKVRLFRERDAAEAKIHREAHAKKRRKRGLSDHASDGKPAPAVRLYALGKKAGKKTVPVDDSEEAKLQVILDDLPLGHSRIGGLPDLPRRKQWPTHKGKKLPFIAQLNLAELPKEAHSLLPRDGHLYLFARIDNAEKQWPPPVAVLLHRGKADTLVRSTLPKKSELWPVWKDALIYEVIPAAGKKSRESVGWLYGKIDRNYGTAGELADQEFFDGDDWINLLAIKSVGNMQWSDYGDLNVLIRRSALEKLDFSNVFTMALSS